MTWPDGTDGDVFRRMAADGFDFDTEHAIDFNIDFNEWPLAEQVEQAIAELYPGCSFIDPDTEDLANGDNVGYVQFQINAKPAYELVVSVQNDVTKNMAPFGGWCDSWGVLQEEES